MNQEASGGCVWYRSPDVAFVDDGERVVVLNLADLGFERPRLLVGPAALIWRALDGRRGVDEITAAVHRVAGTTAGVRKDVLDFLEVLRDERLVHRA